MSFRTSALGCQNLARALAPCKGKAQKQLCRLQPKDQLLSLQKPAPPPLPPKESSQRKPLRISRILRERFAQALDPQQEAPGRSSATPAASLMAAHWAESSSPSVQTSLLSEPGAEVGLGPGRQGGCGGVGASQGACWTGETRTIKRLEQAQGL